jgi:coenzyme F420-0:L-glutamate ligase / coenzyme F420-1:gamma-L-glutamate ligase
MPPRYEVIGVEGIGEVRPHDDVAAVVIEAAARSGTPLRAGDVLVISQKIVSKSEGRLLRLADVTPSAVAAAMAAGLGRDPRPMSRRRRWRPPWPPASAVTRGSWR